MAQIDDEEERIKIMNSLLLISIVNYLKQIFSKIIKILSTVEICKRSYSILLILFLCCLSSVLFFILPDPKPNGTCFPTFGTGRIQWSWQTTVDSWKQDAEIIGSISWVFLIQFMEGNWVKILPTSSVVQKTPSLCHFCCYISAKF